MPVDRRMFVSATTTESGVEEALADLARQLAVQSGDNRLDLMIAFISSQYTYAAPQIVQDLYTSNQPGVLLGCTAEGVIGRDREVEGQAAISLVAARLPGVELTPFLINPADTDWHKLLLDQEQFRCLVEAPEDTRLFILLGDPFSTPMDDVLQSFNTCYRDIPVVGGMASGALRPNGNSLFLNEQVLHEGIVGVAISGQIDVDVVVSQGCRPIWRPFKVMQAHRNVIFNLEGRAPLAWLQDLIPELSAEDRALLQTGLFVGRALHPDQEVLGRGDFLIRGVIGIDQQNGAIAIGDSVMEGEMIQFHLRDAVTAREDLEMMLLPQLFRSPPGGGLLFSCNGRGTRLYDHPNGDISVIQEHLENMHLAGFFCAGEIGPVGGANFLHGHTASLVIFRPIEP